MTATLAPPLEKPRRIGHLVLGRELGTAGVVSVWTARDESKGSAAVTVLRVHPAIAIVPEARARVVAAARKGLLIRHPNVLTSRDVVEDGAELAVVCEPFEGILFRELSLEGPARGISLPLNVLTRVTLEVLAGLEAAHGNANDEDEVIGRKVEQVKSRIREMIERGLRERRGVFR